MWKNICKRVLIDCFIWMMTALLCILWRLIAQKAEILIYVALFSGMMGVWVVCGFIFLRYELSYRVRWYWQEMLSLLLTGGMELLLCDWIIPKLPWNVSMAVVEWTLGFVMLTCAVIILIKHYVKFALNMTVPEMKIEYRNNALCTREDMERLPQEMKYIKQAVLSITTEPHYEMLLEKAHLSSRQTKVVVNRDRYSLIEIPDYKYKTLVDLTVLNEAKGINRRFCIVNQKLPDDGYYVCCYRPQEYTRDKIMSKYPKGINTIICFCWFVYTRVIPRLLLFSRLYYDMTKGHKRMLSKTEVLGRLYYCGFEVEEVIPMGHIEYIIARRHSQPYPQSRMKLYGPIVKLPRVGKNKKIVFFYKFRTMHPYAEYIQQYVFDQRGGMNIADKSDDDWRITRWGKVFRKYWIDELPMLANWVKGDVKLVGVRPISQGMFNKYPKELQDKRTRCKPGLVPPFYIDHPETFEELFASENKYLDEYFEHPIRTDAKYFFAIVRSILFKKMHSA